jgi:CubicO group peptidase (beta-lactamase class C family)
MKLPRLRTILLTPLVLFAFFYLTIVVIVLFDDRTDAVFESPPATHANIAIFGASGTAGDGILKAALADPGVSTIQVITRRVTPRMEEGVDAGKVQVTLHQDYLDYSPILDEIANVDAVFWAIGISAVSVDHETYGKIHVDFPLQFVTEWSGVSSKPEASFHYLSSSDISEDSSMNWAREKVRAEKALFQFAEGKTLRVIAYRPDYIGPTPEEAHLGQDLLYWFFAPVRAAVRATQIGQAMIEVTARGGEYENGDKLHTGSIIRISDAYQRRVAQTPPAQNPGIAERIDAKLSSLMQKESVVGMSIGVLLDDELVFASGYGVRELGKEDAITKQSVFHWASVSKPFVATAVMQLVEGGQLSLNDRLADLLPYFLMADERYREITVEQLLTHTSGMPDVDDYEWDRPQHDDEALKRWAQEQADKELLFAPGSAREYSNIGFELLGLIVQEVSGMPFESYMQQNIFQPLNMVDTSFIANEIDPSLRTTGHIGTPTRSVADAYPYNRRHAPSSTLNTNVVDMSRYARALLKRGSLDNANILSPETLAEMWAPKWTNPEDPSRQASLGWNVGQRWGGLQMASHGGHDDGFRSFLVIAPDEDVAVFVVSNDDNAPVGPFILAVLEVLFPEQAAVEARKD